MTCFDLATMSQTNGYSGHDWMKLYCSCRTGSEVDSDSEGMICSFRRQAESKSKPFSLPRWNFDEAQSMNLDIGVFQACARDAICAYWVEGHS
jgi:hypothetical protein